jgi:MFS family permease
MFRRILVASFVADLGSFMQSVGAAWLMVSMQAGPFFVALTQTASTLPFFLLGLPAGSLGDIVDRRKLILYSEAWMLMVAIVLAATTLSGAMTPWLLLALTFALSSGQAMESPSWRAVLPELVPREDLAAAAALNGIEYNTASIIGPAMAGLLIATAGVGPAFVVYAASFVAVIVVIARWKRPVEKHAAPVEALGGATVAALRYLRYAPSIQAVMVRSATVMFCASATFALLPTIASRATGASTTYGLLLGAFGIGAIGGVVVMERARTRWSAGSVVTTAITVMGLAIISMGSLRSVAGLSLVMFVIGAGWIVFFSLANAQVQTHTPDWIRARIIAVFMLLTEGGLAIGSLLWGAIGSRASVHAALVLAGTAAIVSTALAFIAPWPERTPDVTLWVHWRLPTVHDGAMATPDQGPVLVTVEYQVTPANVEEFLRAMQPYGRVRRRDGAFRWSVFRDVEQPDMYVEAFLVHSWAEHLRQHERLTVADRDLEQHIATLTRGDPAIRHWIHPKIGDAGHPNAHTER